jgi:hypothetical protein
MGEKTGKITLMTMISSNAEFTQEEQDAMDQNLQQTKKSYSIGAYYLGGQLKIGMNEKLTPAVFDSVGESMNYGQDGSSAPGGRERAMDSFNVFKQAFEKVERTGAGPEPEPEPVNQNGLLSRVRRKLGKKNNTRGGRRSKGRYQRKRNVTKRLITRGRARKSQKSRKSRKSRRR